MEIKYTLPDVSVITVLSEGFRTPDALFAECDENGASVVHSLNVRHVRFATISYPAIRDAAWVASRSAGPLRMSMQAAPTLGVFPARVSGAR